jgi:hypothetical protein
VTAVVAAEVAEVVADGVDAVVPGVERSGVDDEPHPVTAMAVRIPTLIARG